MDVAYAQPECNAAIVQRLPSPKSYALAVVLSSVFGWLGVQHFYLGRWAEGLVDVGLTVGWIACFATGHPLWGALFLVLDSAHALTATILLLTGSYRDGQGRRVMYPGQKIPATRS